MGVRREAVSVKRCLVKRDRNTKVIPVTEEGSVSKGSAVSRGNASLKSNVLAVSSDYAGRSSSSVSSNSPFLLDPTLKYVVMDQIIF